MGDLENGMDIDGLDEIEVENTGLAATRRFPSLTQHLMLAAVPQCMTLLLTVRTS